MEPGEIRINLDYEVEQFKKERLENITLRCVTAVASFYEKNHYTLNSKQIAEASVALAKAIIEELDKEQTDV